MGLAAMLGFDHHQPALGKGVDERPRSEGGLGRVDAGGSAASDQVRGDRRHSAVIAADADRPVCSTAKW
jgi:hypothetical protein